LFKKGSGRSDKPGKSDRADRFAKIRKFCGFGLGNKKRARWGGHVVGVSGGCRSGLFLEGSGGEVDAVAADGAGHFGLHAGKILDFADVVVSSEVNDYGVGVG